MIPLILYVTLIAFAGLLILYAVIDNRNRLYFNITAMVVAAITLSYCGVQADAVAVYESVSQLTESNTTQIFYNDTNMTIISTVNTYQSEHPFTSGSMALLLKFIATVAWVYALIMGADAIIEYRKIKEEETAQGDDGS